MGVELRVPVAAGHVAKRRRNHRRRLHPRPPPGRRVPAPRLQQRPLDPRQRRPHRLVMRAHHRPVAARALLRRQQRRERDGFGSREGDVEAWTVLVLPVAQPAQPEVRPQHPALEHLLERPRRDLAPLLQAKRRRPPAVPRAAPPVLRLLRARLRSVLAAARVIAPVTPEILRRRRRGRQIADRRYHRIADHSRAGSIMPPHRAAGWGQGRANAGRERQRSASEQLALVLRVAAGLCGAAASSRASPPVRVHRFDRCLPIPASWRQ